MAGERAGQDGVFAMKVRGRSGSASLFPEVFKHRIEGAVTEGKDRVGPEERPEHARASKTLPDECPTAGFDVA